MQKWRPFVNSHILHDLQKKFLKTLKMAIFVCNEAGVKLVIAQKLPRNSRRLAFEFCYFFFIFIFCFVLFVLFFLFRIFLDYSRESLVYLLVRKKCLFQQNLLSRPCDSMRQIEITSWKGKARAYGIFTRVGEVSEIERVRFLILHQQV